MHDINATLAGYSTARKDMKNKITKAGLQKLVKADLDRFAQATDWHDEGGTLGDRYFTLAEAVKGYGPVRVQTRSSGGHVIVFEYDGKQVTFS